MTKRYHFHLCAMYQIRPGEVAHISNVAYIDQCPAEPEWYSEVKLAVRNQFDLDDVDPKRVIITSLTILHVEEIQ